ncbi:MAG: DUF4270 family protein [Bacteroidia bacterium]|nr:DUF4270 family protein [Bacteroidia bacterium]
MFIFLIFSLFFIFSCKEEPGTMGLGIIPPSDGLFVKFDTTLTFSTYTAYVDSVRSDESVLNTSTSYNLVGSYYDPVFGLTKADFICQALLSSNNVELGPNLVIDSIVLTLRMNGAYGAGRNSPQLIRVYQLTDSINIDSPYYSNLNVEHYYNSNILLGEKYYTPWNDSLLRIHLEKSYLPVLSDTTKLIDNKTFLKNFFGLYITSDPVSIFGSIMYVNLLSSESHLTLYYRNSTGTTEFIQAASRKSYNYVFTSACARVNLFHHNYTAAQYPFVYNNSAYHDNMLYIQATGGMKGKIFYNNLKKWIDSLRYDPVKHDSMRIAVNKAELVFEVDNDTRVPLHYAPPGRLTLIAVQKDSTLVALTDQTLNSSYFDGYYNSIRQTFGFNISLHFQKLVNDILDKKTENFDYYSLFPSDNRGTANRVIIQNSGKYRIRLQLVYIKY